MEREDETDDHSVAVRRKLVHQAEAKADIYGITHNAGTDRTLHTAARRVEGVRAAAAASAVPLNITSPKEE